MAFLGHVTTAAECKDLTNTRIVNGNSDSGFFVIVVTVRIFFPQEI